MKRLWYRFWHLWFGCPKPLQRYDKYDYICPLCGWIASHGGDWGR